MSNESSQQQREPIAAGRAVLIGQLIANLSTLAKGLSAESVWDVEDDELLAAARKQLTYFAERQHAVG